jgi:hypothetical protein
LGKVSHGSGQKNLKGKGWTATRAHRNCVAVARERLHDVEGQGMASEGDAGTGRKDRATRGEGEQEVEGGALRGGGRGAASAAVGSRAGEQKAEGAQRKKMRGENFQGLVAEPT